MNQTAIRDMLVRRGKDKYKTPRYFIEFTGDFDADELVNDLQEHPHAFVIGCILSRQPPGASEWGIPHRLRQRLGSFEFSRLAELSDETLFELLTEPEPLHRMAVEMSTNLSESIHHIAKKYEGDASRIWSDSPSSGELIYRFLELRGVGTRTATMGANILARQFRIPLADYYSVDISVDSHVKRVLGRLGLLGETATNDQVIFKARSLHPEFPGLLNLPAWEIGHNWCKTKQPECQKCYMRQLCPSAAL